MASQVFTVAASAARTTSSDTGALVGFGNVKNLRVQLACTAASGTNPTLNVVVEDSLDGSTWNQIGSFTQLTASGQQAINIAAPFADTIRVRWTLGGTSPSFTFSVVALVQQ